MQNSKEKDTRGRSRNRWSEDIKSKHKIEKSWQTEYQLPKNDDRTK